MKAVVASHVGLSVDSTTQYKFNQGRVKPPHNTIYTMRGNKQYIKVSREKARQIILNTESALTREMVERYTDSELKEWMKQLHFKTDF